MSGARADSLPVANASRITEQLWIGGDVDLYDAGLAVRQLDDLLAQGLTHVLDARLELDDSALWVQIDDVEYRWHPVDDLGQQIPDAWFEEGTRWVAQALADPRSRVLVHCHMGVNRGPSLGYAVLLDEGLDPVSAIALIRRKRPIANVYYAEDALRWWHRRTGADPGRRAREQVALASWRQENPLDVAHVIADIRAREG